MDPAPGEIYRGCLPGLEFPHWLIVVSRQDLNRGSYVVVVATTSKRFHQRRHLPHCVPFRAGEYCFTRDCVAQAESITALHKDYLEDPPPADTLDPRKLHQLIRAVGDVLDANLTPFEDTC